MIQFRDVYKAYDNGTTVLQSLSFDIYDGEFVFIYGPEGSGKTTILNLILREELPTAGGIFINGVDLVRLPEKDVCYFKRRIGFLFHDDRLLGNRTVSENIEFVLYVTGMMREKKDRINMVLDMFNLTNKQNLYPDELSAGEKRKVSVARAYVLEPVILLADEPVSHVDNDTAEIIIKSLLDINKRGTTVVFATSNLNVIERVGKRVIKLA